MGYAASIAQPFPPRNKGYRSVSVRPRIVVVSARQLTGERRQFQHLELLVVRKSEYKGKMMGMEYTPDDAVLTEMGKVTIRHSFLDWTLNRTIKGGIARVGRTGPARASADRDRTEIAGGHYSGTLRGDKRSAYEGRGVSPRSRSQAPRRKATRQPELSLRVLTSLFAQVCD
jgi:hypothetical protein